METYQLNQQLRGLYQPYLDSLYSQSWAERDKVSAPLLMHVFEEYVQMETKILFVGQETHTWSGINDHLSVESLQEKYARFNLGQSAYYGGLKPFRYLTSAFWNFSRSLFYNLNQRTPAVSRKTEGFLWTNISKFDSNGTTPSKELQQRNTPGFELLKLEIATVKPDVVVFLTGTKYDCWLDYLFQPEKQTILDNGRLHLLIDLTNCLPSLTFQTKHPRVLCQEKSYQDVLQAITKKVGAF